MMRKILVAAFAVALLAAIGCGPGELKEYTSAEGKYKVMMYANPKSQNQSAGGIQVNMVMNDLGSKVLAVAYNDFPLRGDEPKEQIDKGLDGARDGAVRNMKGKLISESKITLAGKWPGREFTAEIPDGKGTMKARIYIVGKRLYQQLAGGTGGFVDSADVKKFFESFEVAP